jgi:hypothetical protein
VACVACGAIGPGRRHARRLICAAR